MEQLVRVAIIAAISIAGAVVFSFIGESVAEVSGTSTVGSYMAGGALAGFLITLLALKYLYNTMRAPEPQRMPFDVYLRIRGKPAFDDDHEYEGEYEIKHGGVCRHEPVAPEWVDRSSDLKLVLRGVHHDDQIKVTLWDEAAGAPQRSMWTVGWFRVSDLFKDARRRSVDTAAGHPLPGPQVNPSRPVPSDRAALDPPDENTSMEGILITAGTYVANPATEAGGGPTLVAAGSTRTAAPGRGRDRIRGDRPTGRSHPLGRSMNRR